MVCLEKLIKSQKADGKEDLITQIELTEKCWLARETAHLGARSYVGSCSQSQPGRDSQGQRQ